jgi:hypothetical protein
LKRVDYSKVASRAGQAAVIEGRRRTQQEIHMRKQTLLALAIAAAVAVPSLMVAQQDTTHAPKGTTVLKRAGKETKRVAKRTSKAVSKGAKDTGKQAKRTGKSLKRAVSREERQEAKGDTARKP